MSLVQELMKQYKQIRDIDKNYDNYPSVLYPPSSNLDSKIYAIDGVTSYPLSPMLKERFLFCSKWDNAYLSQNFLSLDEINRFPYNQLLLNWIDLRKENWDDVPPNSVGESRCSIFSFNPYEPEEIYLVWDDDNKEPKVWHYFGSDFYTFDSLERFLLFINEKIGDEDTIRIKI